MMARNSCDVAGVIIATGKLVWEMLVSVEVVTAEI